MSFFQDTQKSKARDATDGFSDQANLDEDDMWPSAFALAEWTMTVEAKLSEFVQQAAS